MGGDDACIAEGLGTYLYRGLLLKIQSHGQNGLVSGSCPLLLGNVGCLFFALAPLPQNNQYLNKAPSSEIMQQKWL